MRIKSVEWKRSMKSFATNKIGAVCPSRISIDIIGIQLKVTFIRKHVGHSCEIIWKKYQMTNDLKGLVNFINRINNFKKTHYIIHTHVFIIISEKLKQGVIMERVLQDICDTVG